MWAYLRNPGFKVNGTNYQASADLTGQANSLSATIQADIFKQKQPTNNGGFTSGKSDLADAVRTAIVNKRAGGMGLISGRKAFQRLMASSF